MGRIFKLLAACGSGIATSSHVSTSLKNGLMARGVEILVRTCSVQEISGLIDSLKPDAIVTTSSLESVKNLGDIKVVSGIPFLTGFQKDPLLDELAEYLNGL